jgi:cobalt-zinc-cadmium resistance protein CzcA
MIQSIVRWSLKNRLIVWLGVMALVASGIHSVRNLNVEAYPDPTPPLVEVITQNPGASPEEMERLVGIPIETALNGMPGLVDLRSTSIAGLNDIKCQFSYDTDYLSARQEVLNRIAGVDELPAGVTPGLSPWSPTGEIVRYVLEGPGYTTNQLAAIQEWVVNRALKQVDGVIDVTGYGGTVKQYQVLVDPRLLRQYDVTLQQVADAIRGSNANIGGDLLALGSQAHNVRAVGLLGSGTDPLDPGNVERAVLIEADKLDDIGGVVVTTNRGVPVPVRQLARVVVGHRPRLGMVGRGDESDVVEGIVLMRKGSRSIPTSEGVSAKIEEINAGNLLPKGVRIVPFYRRTDLIGVTTHNVMHNLLVGMSLVIVVLFVFLGNLTSAGIVALVIPLALLFAINIIYLKGSSANLLSIGAVDFGIIVDSSVVIVEAIYHHLAGHPGDFGVVPIEERVARATAGVDRPILFATMILLTAFIPLFGMTGPAGALFGPMASTYAFSILGALLIAITFAPILCATLFKRHKVSSKPTIVDRVTSFLYGHALQAVMRVRPLLLVGMGLLVAITGWLALGLGAEFMPELEEGNLWIRVVLPRTVGLDEAARIAPRIRREILTVPEVRGVMSHIGRPDDGTDVTSFFNLECNVPLKPMGEWRPGYDRRRIEAELMKRFDNYPGLSFSFSQIIRDNVEEALSGVKGANSVKLFGPDLAQLETVGGHVVAALRDVPGITNVGIFHVVGEPTMEIRIDPKKCARYGLNVDDVESVVQVAVGGHAFTRMVEGEKLYDVVLRLPPDLRDDPEDIARIPVDAPPSADGRRGPRIPLAQLVTIEPHASGASYIYRENNRRYIPIKFGVEGRDLASAIAEARSRVEHPPGGQPLLPPGYNVEWSGEFAQMQEANALLKVMVPISILLILVLLHTMFHSLKDALIVMAGTLSAILGGVWALRITHTTFSISAAVGFISIFGVVVQNGVLLVSEFNRRRGRGEDLPGTILHGSLRLLRPVLMISVTAVLGLLPAALATSIGSQAQKPLAIVVVGGMLTAMILPQFLVPVLYSYFPAPQGQPAGPADAAAPAH